MVRTALTPKQEHFCRLIASGKDYTSAYLTAYYWNGSENGAYTEAIRLANRDDIQERIKALQKPLELAVQRDRLTARDKQIAEILERIEICKAKEDENSLIRYYDMLNKIYALYGKEDTQTKQDTSIDKLDTETLQKLSGIA